MKMLSYGRFWDLSQGQHSVPGHRHSHQHLDHVVPSAAPQDSGPLLQAGQDVPSAAQKPSRDRIQHAGSTSFLGSSMDVVEFNTTGSEERAQFFFLAAAPCLVVGFLLKIYSN